MSPVRYGKGDKGEARWSLLPPALASPPLTCLTPGTWSPPPSTNASEPFSQFLLLSDLFPSHPSSWGPRSAVSYPRLPL